MLSAGLRGAVSRAVQRKKFRADLGYPPTKVSIEWVMKTALFLLLARLVYPLCGCERKPDAPAHVRKRAADATA